MVRILLIAPSCYPITGAEEIVNIKMLQAFATTKDFEVDLVSKKKKDYDYPSDSLASLGVKIRNMELCEVDNQINVKTIWQHFLCFLFWGVVQKGYHWAVPAYKIIKRFIKKNHYDYILTKDAPSYLLGHYIKKKYNIKWVATWNDPYPAVKYPTPYGQGANCKDSKMIKRTIHKMETADFHIFPSERLKNYMLEYLNVNENQCFIIPHAVIGSEKRSFVQNYENGLNLIHSGNLSAPRDPETTLRAVSKFLEKHPEARLSFSVLGNSNPKIASLVEELNLKNVVRYTSPVEYNKSLEIVGHYNIAVIIEANCSEGIFLPTKVSDFLQIGIPVFSISPSIGVLNDLYKFGIISYFASVNDIDSIYESLEQIYNDFNNMDLPANVAINDVFKPISITKIYASFAKYPVIFSSVVFYLSSILYLKSSY